MVLDADAIGELIEPGPAAAVRRLLEPGIRARGLDLVLVELRQERGEWVLRLFVGPGSWTEKSREGEAGAHAERAQGGVTLADCQAVSREVSALLDVADPIPHSYVLEVSSPGLDRPLVKPGDFARFAGRVVRIRTARALQGRQNFKGRLEGLQEDDIVVTEQDGLKRIPYSAIKRAHLVYEF